MTIVRFTPRDPNKDRGLSHRVDRDEAHRNAGRDRREDLAEMERREPSSPCLVFARAYRLKEAEVVRLR